MAPSVAPTTAHPGTRPLSYLDLRPRLLAVAGSLGLLALALEWYRFASYRSLTMDLAVFDQAIWKLAHGHGPEIRVIDWNVFADHLSPRAVPPRRRPQPPHPALPLRGPPVLPSCSSPPPASAASLPNALE